MAIKIGEIKKLVCVGDGNVAAIGEKNTYRFFWEVAHSRARVDELGDVRLNMALRYAYSDCGPDLASAMPRGVVIPLPSAKRANYWQRRLSGPSPASQWWYHSGIAAGFRPRYCLGEKENPYSAGTRESWYWHLESIYLRVWPRIIVDYARGRENISKDERVFLERIPDWQTRVLVAAMAEDGFCTGGWRDFKEYGFECEFVKSIDVSRL